MNLEPLQRNQPIYTLGEDQTTFCDQSKANNWLAKNLQKHVTSMRWHMSSRNGYDILISGYGQKYCQTLGNKPNSSIRIIFDRLTFKISEKIAQLLGKIKIP